MSDDPAPPPLDPAFLALLRCPLSPSRPPLALTPDGKFLRCTACDCPHNGHDFPFTEGFPDLRPLTDGTPPDTEGKPRA